MGFKLIAQLTLVTAALVLIFVYIQPTLGTMKQKQDELFQYNEAVAKAAEFNARLRELISIRDSFSQSDLRALEKFVPTEIDQLKLMSEIAGIFSSNNIPLTSLTAHDIVNPQQEVFLEAGVMNETGVQSDLSYQDFEISFKGTYSQLRDVLRLTEASDSLLEIVELSFGTEQQAEVDENGEPIAQIGADEYVFKIIFRTYGLPIETTI